METKRFEDLGVSKKILKAVEAMGFEEATPIQTMAIPQALAGLDIIGQAQTGTGKTAAFAIPIIEVTDIRKRKPQAICLCPTRELAVQVAEEMTQLCAFNKGFTVLPVYGGQAIDRQIRALQRGVQVVVGTPGRVIDHIKRGTLQLDEIKMLVLDEADEMLDMGFRDDIEEICKTIPDDRQTMMFSATMPKEIKKLIEKYMRNPITVKVQHQELTVPLIEQFYIEVREKNRVEVFSRLIDFHSPNLTMVFCNTKRKVDELVSHLQARGYFADGLHGDLKQHQRDVVMRKFKDSTIDILVATDVAARGIDVDNVDLVVNYDVPQDLEYYVHRIGRTGRAGREGKAFTFVFGKDFRELRDIEKYTKKRILKGEIPSIMDVENIRYRGTMDKISELIENENMDKELKYLDLLADYEYDSDLVAAALLKLFMDSTSSVGDYEKIAEDVTRKVATVSLSLGKKAGLKAGDIVGAIAGECNIKGNAIGKVIIEDEHTLVEVPADEAHKVVEKLSKRRIKGKKFTIEIINK